jgi:hypothetical protein
VDMYLLDDHRVLTSMQAITLTASPHSRHVSIGADATPFATEGHEMLGMAGVTTHPQEAMFQTAAF